MMDSPGWFIVCWHCGGKEEPGFPLIPYHRLAEHDATAPNPVTVAHMMELDDGELAHGCPTSPSPEPPGPYPKAE